MRKNDVYMVYWSYQFFDAAIQGETQNMDLNMTSTQKNRHAKKDLKDSKLNGIEYKSKSTGSSDCFDFWVITLWLTKGPGKTPH